MVGLNYRDPGTGDFVPLGGDSTPIGSVMGFGGSVAPAGWHICDGTPHGSDELRALLLANGSATPDFTPDLRDRFIVGSSVTKAIGTTGGVAAVTLTAAQSGAQAHAHPSIASGTVSAWHTHSISYAAPTTHTHNHGYRTDTYKKTELTEDHVDYPLTGVNNSTNVVTEPAGGSHTHTGTSGSHSATHTHLGGTATANAAADATASHENRPPYFALVYIIKVA